MQLKDVLAGVKIIKCSIDLSCEFENIALDSRKIQKNDIFIAIKGNNFNGNEFIEEVKEQGALCAITQEENNDDFCVMVEDVRLAASQIYNNFYKNPSKSMKIIAITGTNGKTSTAMFLYSILRTAKKSVGLISTIKCLINDSVYDINGGSDLLDSGASMTTPDPGKLYETLYEMERRGVEYVVMEASSHALELKKLDALNIRLGIFTNLSKDHLDFHKNINNYFNSKKRLSSLSQKMIINTDDEYGELLANNCHEACCFSTKKKANFFASKIKISSTGCSFLHVFDKRKIRLASKVLGDFTVYNISLAAAATRLLNIKDKYIKKGIKNCKQIDGRLEKTSKNIYIDFAHTPQAMEKVLLYFKKIFPKKKIKVLFGCGGNRDTTKRKEMGQIASRLADSIIITSDNSRYENPLKIVEDIKEGILENTNYCIILDRKEAILYALRSLKKNEILLMLGKGHENYEILNGEKKFFSEKDIVIEALKNAKNT